MRASSTLGAMQKALAMRAEGLDVVDLGAGEPDFDTPAHVKLAADRAMRRGETKYTATGGTTALKRAIVGYYEREFGARYEPREVMATAGGKQAIFNAVVTLVNPGDEVLVAKPYWVTFPEIVKFAGATPVFVETEENGFQLTADAVARSITTRTRLLIINSPSNPSGRVVPPAEFRRIVEACAERGVSVVSDECYLQFVYPPGEVFSAASLPAELRARVCVAGSFSKTYAMTGWRIGYALAPRPWAKEMLKVQSHSTSNPSSIAQAAAVEALKHQDAVAERVERAVVARVEMESALTDLGLRVADSQANFCWLHLPDEVVEADVVRSLHEQGILVRAGAALGREGALRVTYGRPDENERFVRALEALLP